MRRHACLSECSTRAQHLSLEYRTTEEGHSIIVRTRVRVRALQDGFTTHAPSVASLSLHAVSLWIIQCTLRHFSHWMRHALRHVSGRCVTNYVGVTHLPKVTTEHSALRFVQGRTQVQDASGVCMQWRDAVFTLVTRGRFLDVGVKI